VIVIDRLVVGPVVDHPDEGVGRIVANGNGGRPGRFVAQILRNGLAHQHGHTRPAAARAVAQLLVRGLRQPQIGRRVIGHPGGTISQYRDIVKRCEARLRGG
jgi:hypothetical protein